MKIRKASVVCAAIGVLFFAAVVAAAFPSQDPDRWKYVTLTDGIPVTIDVDGEESTFFWTGEASGLPQAEDGLEKETLQRYSPETLDAVERWLESVEIAPIDAKLELGEGTTPFVFVAGKTGRCVERQNLYRLVYRAVRSGGGTVRVFKADTDPTVTRSKLYRETEYRGGYETNIEASSDARKHNVRLALSRFNGLSVPTGGRVSFNEVVGPRTEEAGYKTAKVIFMGEYVDGVGGGVCQASTTVYNAVVLSGLSVETVWQHSLTPSYVSPGRDAMVNSDGADLVFLNTTASAVHFRVYDDDSRVRVEIFGEKTAVSYRLESRVLQTIEPVWEMKEDESVTLATPADAPERILRQPKNGIVSETYLHAVGADGAETISCIRRNRYAAVNGIYLIPKPTEIPTPYADASQVSA